MADAELISQTTHMFTTGVFSDFRDITSKNHHSGNSPYLLVILQCPSQHPYSSVVFQASYKQQQFNTEKVAYFPFLCFTQKDYLHPALNQKTHFRFSFLSLFLPTNQYSCLILVILLPCLLLSTTTVRNMLIPPLSFTALIATYFIQISVPSFSQSLGKVFFLCIPLV